MGLESNCSISSSRPPARLVYKIPWLLTSVLYDLELDIRPVRPIMVFWASRIGDRPPWECATSEANLADGAGGGQVRSDIDRQAAEPGIEAVGRRQLHWKHETEKYMETTDEAVDGGTLPCCREEGNLAFLRFVEVPVTSASEVWRQASSAVPSSSSSDLHPIVLEEGWEAVWIGWIVLDRLGSRGVMDSADGLTWAATVWQL